MYEKLPEELKQNGKFCLWKYECRNGRKTKVPYRINGKRCNPADKNCYTDFDTACRYVSDYDGIGLGVFDDICGVDIDDCIRDGAISDTAADIIDTLNSYTEISPSGTGIRIICYCGDLKYSKEKYYINNRKNHVEVYVPGFTNRFLTVTGNAVNDSQIRKCDKELITVLDKYMKRPDQPINKADKDAHISCLSDKAVIEKAMSSRNGNKFMALWNGEIPDGASHSEADLSLMDILAFWCSGNEEQMVRLFEQSGLMREKFNRKDYRDATVKKAISGCREFYSPIPVSNAANDFEPILQKLNELDFFNCDRYKNGDIGCGRLLADVFRAEARYVPQRKQWFIYDGKRWVHDEGGMLIMELSKSLADAILVYALKIDDEDKRTKYLKAARNWQQRKFRETYIKEAQSVYPKSMDSFDTDKYLFNCCNGTFDLKRMIFREHNAEDFITKMSPAKYDPNAYSERFISFIHEIMCGDKELISYLQKSFGYALPGINPYECLFFLYGPLSRNGKGTIAECILQVMGDYGRAVSPETLAQKMNANSHGPTEDIARLAGIRFANISEPSKSLILNAAMVKQLTGNDTITARFLNEKSFDFKPQFKIYINTNYLPVVNDATFFSSDRVVIIPFNRHFSEEERDRNLKRELSTPEVQSAILNWLIEGYRLIEAEGFEKPAAVVEAVKEYSLESNKVKQFFDECLKENSSGEVKTTDAYQEYRQWCNNNGCYAENLRNFVHEIKRYAEVQRKRPRTGGDKTTVIIGYDLVTVCFL